MQIDEYRSELTICRFGSNIVGILVGRNMQGIYIYLGDVEDGEKLSSDLDEALR